MMMTTTTTPPSPASIRIVRSDGTLWDVVDKSTWTLDLREIATGLAHTCRYGGLTPRYYSVAQHSWYVASLVPDRLKATAMLHDAGEIYGGGDLQRPLKHLAPALVGLQQTFDAWIAERLEMEYPWPVEVMAADDAVLQAEARDLFGLPDGFPEVAAAPADIRIQPRLPACAQAIWLGRWEKYNKLSCKSRRRDDHV